jgi:predicted RNase H-like HicB family nuclease
VPRIFGKNLCKNSLQQCYSYDSSFRINVDSTQLPKGVGRRAAMATREEVYEILHGVEFTSRIRQASSGMWIAYCEEVPAARTQGETEEEVEENLVFILEDYSREQLEELRERLVSARKEPLIL